MKPLPPHLSNLSDEQKMKLITYVGGFDTRIVGGIWGAGETMRYRIVPKKSQLFVVTSSHDRALSTIGYVLNFVAFINDAIKEKYSTDNKLTSSEQTEKSWWENQLTLPLKERQNNNLTPLFITHVSEDETLVSDTASGAIDLFFRKLVDGAWFISFRVKEEQATLTKWEDNCVVNSFYSLMSEWRGKSDSWQHMDKGGDFRCTIAGIAA